MLSSRTLLLINCYHVNAGRKIRKYHDWIADGSRDCGLNIVVREVSDRGDLPEDNFDFAIVSGSWKMVAEGDVTAGLRRFLRSRRKPLLGICYGHQALAHAFGARVVKDTIRHDGTEKISLPETDALFKGFPPEFEMRESHEEVVTQDEKLEGSFRVTATGPGGTVESIAHRILPFFGVQFHPEESGAAGLQLLLNFLRTALSV